MAASQPVTEAEMVLQVGYETSDPNTSLVPVAFFAQEVNVRVYRDVDESLAGLKTFNFDYTNKSNPLLEKELFHQLGKVMQAHGLIRVKENPQILITMDFFIGKYERYTPPTTVTSTQLQTVWNTGMIGWNVGGFSSQVPITSSTTQAGYTTTSYYTNIRLNFLNYVKLAGGTKPDVPPLLWIGEADHQGPDPDIRGIASPIFGELMGEFPSPSAKTAKRRVRYLRFGSLGLGVDRDDWRIIRSVAPSSPADVQKVKPGDVLTKINGQGAHSWPSFKFWGNSIQVFRDADPYFKYILSNNGDRVVEVVIQSPETGKRAIRMTPQRVERYLEEGATGFPR
jgi:hypothetical protein